MNEVYLQLTSGYGPRECAYVVKKIWEKIKREALLTQLNTELIEHEVCEGLAPEAWLSATIKIYGSNAEDFITKFIGTIQWVAKSPYRPHHNRKNWYIGVNRLRSPEVIKTPQGTVQIKNMKSSGPGGQNVNKTRSAVRVIHEETGISVTSRKHRSQQQNRREAFKKLAETFAKIETMRQSQYTQENWNSKQAVTRGNAVRIFYGDGFKEK